MKGTLMLCLVLLLCAGSPRAEDASDCATRLKTQEEVVARLTEENARLQGRVKLFECAPTIGRDDLVRRNLQRLQDIARDVKAQRQSTADFERYVSWMTGSLSSYSKYIEAGSAAAAFARFLPVPYAGQAGAFAKFVAHFALTLNSASNSIASYLKTSQQFVSRVEALDPAKPLNHREIADLGRFADGPLLKETGDVQAKLGTTADLSASALSFLEGMNQYLSSTDEYWNKTKQFVTRKEENKKEKSFLTESISNLRAQAAAFNGRFRLLEESAKRDVPLIKSLGAYDELIQELEAKRPSAAPTAPEDG